MGQFPEQATAVPGGYRDLYVGLTPSHRRAKDAFPISEPVLSGHTPP